MIQDPSIRDRKAWASSAAAAYRADLLGRGVEFGPHDGAWVTVAELLHHASVLPVDERRELLERTSTIARETLGESQARHPASRKWGDSAGTVHHPIVVLADSAHQAGALHLAALMFDALLASDTSLDIVQQGRIRAERARVSLRLGSLDEAADRCRLVEQTGRRAKSPELRARAHLGLAAVAQMRGNFPEMVNHVRRAQRAAAATGLPFLIRDARFACMIAAGVRQEVDAAVAHGWAVYELSRGEPGLEAEILQSLGQVFLEAGYPEPARAAFAVIVSLQLPPRVILPALGGLALAAARSNEASALDWAVREVLRAESSQSPRYPVSSALLECALALSIRRRVAEAERCRNAALRIARTHGFHEIAYRAEELAVSHAKPETSPRYDLDSHAVSVARQVSWMEPERLPKAIDWAAVPA